MSSRLYVCTVPDPATHSGLRRVHQALAIPIATPVSTFGQASSLLDRNRSSAVQVRA